MGAELHLAASRSFVANPGFTLLRRMKLFTRSPAPTSSTRATAISAITRLPCSRRRREPVVPAESSRSVPSTRGVEARHAGSNPNTRPVTMARPKVNTRIRQSTAMSPPPGSARGQMETRARMPQRANSAPTAPAASDRRTLSVSSCRTRRPRAAPNAPGEGPSRAARAMKSPSEQEICQISRRRSPAPAPRRRRE